MSSSDLTREQIKTKNGRILGNRYAVIDDDLSIIYTNKNEEIRVSTQDLPMLLKYTWLLNNYGYVYTRSYERKSIMIHRLILGVTNPKIEIDHIDRNPLNNTRNNLRITDRVTNCRNTRVHKDTKSGFRGVSWRKDTKKWSVHIKVNYKKISLGCYTNLEEAIARRIEAEKEYWGEYL